MIFYLVKPGGIQWAKPTRNLKRNRRKYDIHFFKIKRSSLSCSILMAFVTAHLVDLMAVVYPNASDIMIGLQTGFWVWFGYIAAYVLTAISFENRPWKYYFINTGYWLVGALIMGVILNVWK